MAKTDLKRSNGMPPRILLVDDEERFRKSLAKQLAVRGYDVVEGVNGAEAIKIVRHKDPEVVILDLKMPHMDGVQTLREIKKIRPEVQVIMLTGYGSMESARKSGQLDVFRYMEKPCTVEELVGAIEEARKERVHAMARHEIPAVPKTGIKDWLIGVHNSRPGVIILGIIIFTLITALPAPQRLNELLATPKVSNSWQPIVGYSDYRKMKEKQTIADYYSRKAGLVKNIKSADGGTIETLPSIDAVSLRARVMVGTLVIAALFWATGALPVGITALLVGVLMYFFGVLKPDDVAKAYAKDSVVFIFGVLAMAMAVTKTGLDKRIGLILLGTSRSIFKFAFLFAPMLALTASFVSEHALVAFIAPVLMLAYVAAIRSANIQRDRALVVMLLLLLTFSANIGGPGSPAAGGRNAVMLGIMADYGVRVGFGQWMMYGLPFVPVMALVIAAYFYVVFRNRIILKDTDIAEHVRRESEKIGKMTRQEYYAAAALILLILLWTTTSKWFGLGGPVILILVLMNVLGIINWRDINSVHFDVVALYAAASALGAGLAYTGGALWLADGFINLLPEWMRSGTGLAISSSLFTGIMTNFMSDGATVAAIGPITVPMAALSNTSPVMVGLATAFASSFAHMLIIGTPNNAIVYSMARDWETGEQLVTMKDFLIHGFFILLLSFMVLWGWAFFGYWRWIGF